MKRRLFALLAVPALTLGFALASPGTDEAQAYGFPSTIHCDVARFLIAHAEYYGDHETAGQIYATAVASGCDPWNLL